MTRAGAADPLLHRVSPPHLARAPAPVRSTDLVSDSRTKSLIKIRRAALMVEVRLRLGRALQVLPISLTIALAATAATLSVRKALPHLLSNRRAWEILIATGALVVVSIVVALVR